MYRMEYMVWVRWKHELEFKKLECGPGTFMRFDCICWFMEETSGIHRKKWTNCYLQGWIENTDELIKENEVLKPYSRIVFKRKPYSTKTPLHMPNPIKARFSTLGLKLF